MWYNELLYRFFSAADGLVLPAAVCFLSGKKGSDVILRYEAGTIDVAVIGAGHAGVEAALAAARLGCSTMLFT